MAKKGKKRDLNAKVYLIGEASRISGPCPNTIKTYVKNGIAEDTRDARGRRVFCLRDIARIKAHYEARNPERIARDSE